LDWVILDLETTGLSPESDDIIEIAAIRESRDGTPALFHTLVKPRRPVPDAVRTLTGLTDEALSGAPSLEEIWPDLCNFLAGGTVTAHNARFDLGFLRASASRLECADLPLSDALDTQVLAKVLLPGLQDHSLANLAKCLSISPTPCHRALPDAQALAGVFAAFREIAETLPSHTLEQLARLAGFVSPALSAWFSERAEARRLRFGDALPAHAQRIQSLVFRAPGQADGAVTNRGQETPKAQSWSERSLAEVCQALLGENSPIRRWLPAFRPRPGQQEMAQAVAQAMDEGHHLVAEAGTGTGKSLAYLIPAVLHAKRQDTRVVVSTHTVALQDQIRDRDFPVLRQALGEDISLAVFKGRNHYVCMRKVEHEARSADLATPPDETVGLMSVLRWLVDTSEGIREELALRGPLQTLWLRIQSESETCIGRRCPFFKPCFYFRARARAHEADVIVTNHSLVFADLQADHRILPKYDHLVFDEAHHLEEEATHHLGEEVQAAHVAHLMQRLVRENRSHGLLQELVSQLSAMPAATRGLPILDRLAVQISEVRPLFDAAFAAAAALLPPGETMRRFDTALRSTPQWSRYAEAVEALCAKAEALEADAAQLADWAQQVDLEADVTGGRLLDAAGLVREVTGALAALGRTLQSSDLWVDWVEQSGSDVRSLTIHRAPLDVARLLRDQLFRHKRSVVLTSATLSVGGDFQYVRKGLGLAELDRPVQAIAVKSPFRMDQQAMLCIPKDIPDLSAQPPDQAAAWLSDSLERLAETSGGRLLVLFTSHALLRAVASRLRHRLRSRGLRLLAQGIDGERTRLIETFRAHPQSVLLGAQSFWEGIDLPGDQLTTLAIVRLPFAPPTHPVAQARAEQLQQSGQSAFWTLSLPEAVVRFRQGVGRLIRTVHDRGVVVVYDKRIITARYGTVFLRSVPGLRPAIDTESALMEQIRAFLAHGGDTVAPPAT
jgi:ATP-dependent DNA helicase DinG